MAKYNAEFTPPSATMLTELYYAETDTVAPTQVFGVQGIPEVDTPPDDITYRTLESDVEYGVPGVKPFSAIEVEILYYKEQYTALKALEGQNLFWYQQHEIRGKIHAQLRQRGRERGQGRKGPAKGQ